MGFERGKNCLCISYIPIPHCISILSEKVLQYIVIRIYLTTVKKVCSM